MKITDVRVWLVEGLKYNWTLLKIFTDEGLTGVGEATNWPGAPSSKRRPGRGGSASSAWIRFGPTSSGRSCTAT